MNQQRGTPQGQDEAIDLNRDWILSEANAEAGRRYRQGLHIELATGGIAEELRFGLSTGLTLLASNYLFDALDDHAPERAEVRSEADGPGLRISLPRPRPLTDLRLRSAKALPGAQIDFFRSDGSVTTDEPFTTWPVASIETRTRRNTPAGAVLGLVADTEAQTLAVETTAVTILSNIPVIDAQFVIRVRQGSVLALSPADLIHAQLRTQPENLRLGLRLPTLGEEVFYLPLEFPPNIPVDASTALREQLTRLVTRLAEDLRPAPLPDPLELNILVESDAPCRFRLTDFRLEYQLARASFPDGRAKQVLRFSADQTTPQRLTIQIPPGIHLSSAFLPLAAPSSVPTALPAGPEAPFAPSPGDTALHLEPGHSWASAWDLTEPTLIQAFDLLLSTSNDDSRLQLELIQDANGHPGGERLTGSEARVVRADLHQLLRFTLDRAALLQPGRYWLVLEIHAGEGLWHLEPAPDQRLLRRDRSEWIAAELTARRTIARPSPASGDPARPAVTLEGMPLSPIHNAEASGFDLLSALGNPVPANQSAERTLLILFQGTRPVTFYPPRLVFDL